MTTVTIFGLQRSGTNFTEQLVKRNIKGVNIVNNWSKPNGIWKHAYGVDTFPRNGGSAGNRGDKAKYEMIGKQIVAWYIHKNPYSWIESICRRNVDIKKHNPQVIHNEKNAERKRFGLEGLDVGHLAELYRVHTDWWYNLCSQRKIFHLSYEDLIRTPETTRIGLNAFAQHYNLQVTNPNEVAIPDKVGQSDKFNEQSRERYNKVQLKLLTWDHICVINNTLNHEHTYWQGYEIIGTQEKYNQQKL